MADPYVNTNNVIVGIATLWIGAQTEGSPISKPADSVALGASWGDGWVAPGATQQGVKISYTPKTVDIGIEEQPTPADVTVDTVDLAVSTTLMEDTLANISLAYGGDGALVVTAPGAEQVGKTTLTLVNGIAKLSLGFEGVNAYGYWRRVYIPTVLSVGQVATDYRRAQAARMYPLNLRAICDPSDVVIEEMTAPVT